MLKNQNKQLSIYSILFSKIPENHMLKLINLSVDFSFVKKLLEKSYSKYYGRPARARTNDILLALQYLYNLSDERVIEDASFKLAFMYFLCVNPEDDLPHTSL